jgi:hypothetical protein
MFRTREVPSLLDRRRGVRLPRPLGSLAVLLLAVVVYFPAGNEARSDQKGSSSAAEHQGVRLGPKSTLSVLWVGHSLIENKAVSSWGAVDLMTLVGRFAASRKLSYAMTDHTLFGSPLSALWRGKPHSFSRDASAMISKREDFERDASRYDAIVLTEAIPLAGTMRYEFSAYYLRRFYCTVLKANPQARVYLYQTWVAFQGSHLGGDAISSGGFDWRAAMKADRIHWEALSDAARKAAVDAPHWLGWLGWPSVSDGGCTIEDPIYWVPVGNALLALDERVSASAPGEPLRWPDGKPFQMSDMVANPWVASQSASESDAKAAAAARPRDPSKPMDDIHPSFAGVYFSALVHFATLYRQSPLDLPYPSELGGELARALQCVAWKAVLDDTRTGVSGEADC